MDLGCQDEASKCDRVDVILRGAGLLTMHRRARLGQEVLDYDLLDVTVASVAGGDRLERVHAVLAALTDAHEDPGRERDPQLAGELERRQTTRRGLVGCSPVALQVVHERLDHHALRGCDLPERRKTVGIERSSIGMG